MQKVLAERCQQTHVGSFVYFTYEGKDFLIKKLKNKTNGSIYYVYNDTVYDHTYELTREVYRQSQLP